MQKDKIFLNKIIFLEERLHKLQLKLEEVRKQRSHEIENQLVNLKLEQKKIEERLSEIDIMEGKAVANLQGEYQQKLIEEMTEISIHSKLFNFPKPQAINI